MYFYVYMLEDLDGNYYYGSRGSKVPPEEDSYMGSMKTWKPNKFTLTKTILKSDFESRTDAYKFEYDLIKEHIANPLNQNYILPCKKSSISETIKVIDKYNGKVMYVRTKDPRYINEEVIKFKGVNVIDNNGKLRMVDIRDSRLLDGTFMPTKEDDHLPYKKRTYKISRTIGSSTGKIWIKFEDSFAKCVHKEELDEYIAKGWVKGRLTTVKEKCSIKQKGIKRK